jgi:ribosomal protein S12 methylthiotransferase accessory factor
MSAPQMVVFQRGEREFSIEDGARRAISTMDELGLTPQLDCYGGDPTVWRCVLFGGGRAVPSGLGYGKGRVAGARVGALYEALEHHLTQQHGFAPAKLQLRTCAEVAQSALSSEAYAGILAEQPDSLIACRLYHQLGGTDTLAVPLFLSNVEWVEDRAAPLRAQLGDTTDYRPLARYSSNSGSAIGGSLTEALVHAINEAIERDAFSLFLARTFLAATPAPPAFLALDTLPAELRELHRRVQTRMGRQVWLVDITTDLGVPTTLAYAPGPRGHYVRGCGTSLSRHYSIERALTELLECHLTDDRLGDRLAGIQLLGAYPALQACAAFDLHAPTASTSRVPYIDTPAPPSPDQHLQTLLETLANRGFTAYLSQVYASANEITAVHVHVPGLEHFHLIADGPSAVLPGRRALTAAQAR